MKDKVTRTEEEWRAALTPELYRVARLKAAVATPISDTSSTTAPGRPASGTALIPPYSGWIKKNSKAVMRLINLRVVCTSTPTPRALPVTAA